MEKRSASVIIIGGGIVACATAYNLAKRGMKDVLVLEKRLQSTAYKKTAGETARSN